jgi:putative protease
MTAPRTDDRLSLPLVGGAEAGAATWQGWTLLSDPETPPEPVVPQGAYRMDSTDALLDLPVVGASGPVRTAELLAPAGGPEAAFAAFHFGADAIYLGLKKFSARAEAENFTLDEVDEITAYAHSLAPRRRVFVTVNTLIRQDELSELVEALTTLDEIGVDAVILQDLGVYHLIRAHFPRLELHASTQLAVHNRAGAEALREMGFRRVVLARELTFEEVHDITRAAGIETEVFIHGALCYSYSGLCLFSAQTLGRSGNRGKCAYSCRDSFDVKGAPLELRDGSSVKRDPGQGFPFSMKDLALPDHLPALQAAGVSCFKIEGRKKSPLYVGTTTDYYRKLLDGTLPAHERPEHEAAMQTVFSRPWTRLFVQAHTDKEVADRDTVGHRGTLIGKVDAVLGGPEPRLRFQTLRTLQRHDGLQVDLPTLGKPFGFPIDRLWTVTATTGRSPQKREVFEASAGAVVEVGLPRDYPTLPVGAPVYCSSSQEVKQRYQYDKPKPGLHRTRHGINVELIFQPGQLIATGRLAADSSFERTVVLKGSFSAANDCQALESTARMTFEKLGQTRLELQHFALHNPAGLFVPVSRLNQVRRDLTAALEQALRDRLTTRIGEIQQKVCPAQHVSTAAANVPLQWSIKVDRADYLDAFEDTDFVDVDEVIIDIGRDHPALLQDKLDGLAQRLGSERIRLALPALTRSWEDRGLRHKIERFSTAGWTRWQAANLSAWKFLPFPSSCDLSTDWSVYVINRLAALELLDRGVTRFTLSPEDGIANVRSLLAEFGERASLIVYQDTPLFLAESCAYANLIGGCPGKANCKFESMEMVSSHGEKVTALDYHCRTIVLNQGPFCLSTRLADLRKAGATSLRADFIYRRYEPTAVRDRWRLVRSGRPVPGGHAANFDRGLL